MSEPQREHWQRIYSTKADNEVSWTQDEPSTSLTLIRSVATSGAVIDIGGGASVLAGRLLDDGYSVTVLDISEAALTRARDKLGARASQVNWLAADVTKVDDLGTFDVWHDRAVFHFLTTPADQASYIALAERTIRAGGHLVIGTFALDGPAHCSGLPVERYDAHKLAARFGAGFALKRKMAETHRTPWGDQQKFQFAMFERL
jgi:2-polyprenyl-3-methyl-5-hydroxy-6-metoxy-1,4-benzoquinol methylase